MKSLLGLLVVAFAWAGCARTDSHAYVVKHSDDLTEVMLTGRFLGAGGPCTGPTLPSRYESVDWLYFPSGSRGRIAYDKVIVTDERGSFKRTVRKHVCGGWIEYDGSTLKVELSLDQFDEHGRVGENAYKHNGTYVVEPGTPAPPPPSK